MGKGAKKAELQNSGDAQARSKQLYGESQGDYNFLDPQLKKEATDPQGYTPQQLAYMRTASSQSLGGGVGATTGQANLEAARTKNAGGFQAAVGTANRGAQRQESENALGIEKSQAQLQEAQKQQALQSLQSLYGTGGAQSIGNLQTSNQALNDENHAPNFWQQWVLAATQAAGQAGAAAAGA